MKNFLIFILIICICFNALLLSSCKKSAEKEEVKEIKLASNTEIVDFSLIDNLKKGMTYEEVTKILNNPGRETNYGEVFVYRLEEDRGLFISFNSDDNDDKRLDNFKIEPFIDPSIFDNYIVKQIERNGSVPISIDLLRGGGSFGTTGIHIGTGYGLHEYYLSDGRVIQIYCEPGCGDLAVEAKVVDTWFEP